MEKKKIIILLILFVAVAGLTISSTNAATKTTGKIYFKDGKSVTKSLGNKQILNVYYTSKRSEGQGLWSPNTMVINIYSSNHKPPKYELVKATVKFSKKVNGKTYYSTKTFKATKSELSDNKWIYYSPKNSYKPYSAVVTYKD